MSLRELMESDVSRVLERDLAETLSYRTEDGSVKRVAYVEWGREQVTENEPHHQLQTEVVSLQVRKELMPDPKLGDAIQFDGSPSGVWWDFVSRVECECVFDVKWRKRLKVRSGIRPSQL